MSENTHLHEEPSYLVDTGKRKGILAWLTTIDHKRIALLYLWSIMVFFIVGGILGETMRTELYKPGQQFYGPQTYNAIFTLHGLIMIFLIVIPGLTVVFGNFVMPIMIGANDVAFPRLNLFTWYLYILGAAIVVVSQFTGDGPPDTGWTFYAPYSTQTPLLPWAIYATAWIQILATPVIGITLLMIIAERTFHIGFFDPALGGDPVLYQHLFWIYSHPAVYIMILPAMGVITEIIPTFCQKQIYGYKAIAISSLAIAGVGYFVWGHHMFTSGMSKEAIWLFSILTFLVAVPSAIKVFNWVATMYKGSIDLKPPLLYAIAFIFLFMIGGFTGLVQGALATDIQVHDTAFIVAHFHYIIFGGVGFAFLGAIHYWYPKMFGRMYSNRIANIAWGFLFAGFNLLYFPQFIIGLEGMPRRYFDYLPQFTTAQQISTWGGYILAIGMIIMIVNLFRKKGEKATANPWGGKTLEWTLPSPPPMENFTTPPVVPEKPYNYD
ncbi:MAG: cbb3-type cytochrome c oxidase subunit I [Bacteroidetes bacterium]|nr:cbb3-type cytochrome c oxidase subunit I [Bacteroidota bacterium]